MATEALTESIDPELQATAWDLEPLVDGEGKEGVERAPRPRRWSAAQAFAERHAGKLAELDGDGAARGDDRARRDPRARRPRRLLRGAALLRPTPPTRPTARCCSGCRSRRPRSRRRCCSSSCEWAALPDERAEELLAGDGPAISLRHHLRNVRRYREHLLTEPEEKILAEKALTGRERVDAPVRGADLGDRGAARRRRAGDGDGRRRRRRDGGARRRAQPPVARRPRRAAHDAPRRSPTRSRPGCARARSCSTRCSPTRRPTTACAAIRTGWRPATSPTRRATSRCRR